MNRLTVQTSHLTLDPTSAPPPFPCPPSPAPPPPRRYHVQLELLDRTAPSLSSDHSSSFSPLLPRTATGLPPALDQEVRQKGKRLVLPRDFWQHLPVSRPLDLTAQPDKVARELLIGASVATKDKTDEKQTQPTGGGPRVWSETFGEKDTAPAIATSQLYTPSRQASQPQQKALLGKSQSLLSIVNHAPSTHVSLPRADHRFGPISLDWIDNPQPLTPALPPMSPTTAPGQSLRSPSPSASSLFTSPRSAAPPLPVGPPRPAQTSGTTDLHYGIVHLYREAGADESSPAEKREALARAGAEDDGTVVGLVSVPGILTAAWLLAFMAPALESIAQMRMVRDASPNRTMVLIRFREAADAAQFMFVYNHKPYHDTKDSELCHVVPISAIKLKPTSTPPFTFPHTPDIEKETAPGRTGAQQAATEIPTCPVCLERLDASVSGLIQISCSHAYHCACLLKWADSRCPVCRQTQANSRTRSRTITSSANAPHNNGNGHGNGEASHCAVCQSPSNLWACLICGNVGCGRYQGGHAHSHFDETGHSFSMELETQRVWDYIGDSYVHRLIRNRTDGKLVELPSLAATRQSGADDDEGEKQPGAGGRGPDRSAEASQDKIEAIGLEYANLMTSQLDSQREYYEQEVAREKDERRVVSRKWEEALAEQARAKKLAQDREREAAEARAKIEREREELKARLETQVRQTAEEEARRKREQKELAKAKRELERSLEAEQAVTKSLTENLGSLRSEMKKREDETAAVRAEVEDLKDQMRGEQIQALFPAETDC